MKKLEIVAYEANNACSGTNCPTVYATGTGSFIVQGYDAAGTYSSAGLTLPDGELAVEIPGSVVEMLISKYRK